MSLQIRIGLVDNMEAGFSHFWALLTLMLWKRNRNVLH